MLIIFTQIASSGLLFLRGCCFFYSFSIPSSQPRAHSAFQSHTLGPRACPLNLESENRESPWLLRAPGKWTSSLRSILRPGLLRLSLLIGAHQPQGPCSPLSSPIALC